MSRFSFLPHLLRHRAVVPLLLAACAPAASPAGPPAMPAPRDGADLVGTPVADLLPERWIGELVPVRGPGAARATLLRWWTDTCPYCASSLQAVERLRAEYGDAGLATVAVYHPKPPRISEDAAIAAAARERGYHGALAVDEGWESLRRIWLDRGDRRATSVSFLLDDEGVVRFVHPGPEFFPAEQALDPGPNRDHEALETAIRELLAEDG